MKILISGWSKIPHSYSLVNIFQMLEMLKMPNVQLFLREEPYYRENWKPNLDFLPKEYSEILSKIPVYNNETVDLEYRITYPYNVSNIVNRTVVFGTAEYSKLNVDYFNFGNHNYRIIDDNLLSEILANSNLSFVTPSKWSKLGFDEFTTKTTVIGHGFDPELIKYDISKRSKLRNTYGIAENDTVFLNLGAMTGNKGIGQILQSIFVLTRIQKNVKLILKGMADLYDSKTFLMSNFNSNSEIDLFIESHIIYLEKTLSFKGLNNLYNCADYYLSPYLAEGFNIPVLESLAANCKVIVSDQGSTSDFVNEIKKVASDFVYLIPTKIKTVSQGNHLEYSQEKLNEIVLKAHLEKKPKIENHKLSEFMVENYSWKKITNDLVDVLKKNESFTDNTIN